jgi:chemotaxis protein MotB
MIQHRKKESHENHERWLVSYADFITLLFAFFVVMYGMSAVDAKKMKQVAFSFQQAFSVTGNAALDSIPVIDAKLAQSIVNSPLVLPELSPITNGLVQKEQVELQRIEQDIHEVLQKSSDSKHLLQMVNLYVDEYGLVISLSAKYFFDSGKAVLRSEVFPIIDQIAHIIQPLDREIRIEGHTDDVPIQTPSYPSNWELSAARATHVIKYLLEKFNFPPQRLSAAGYAEFRPIALNSTEDGRARNRRVDIVLLSRKIVSPISADRTSHEAVQESFGLEKE